MLSAYDPTDNCFWSYPLAIIQPRQPPPSDLKTTIYVLTKTIFLNMQT